jgi:hypothetical protein
MSGAGFVQAWYTAALAWLPIPLGCLMLLVAYHPLGGRLLEALGMPILAGARALPPALLLLVPASPFLSDLFPPSGTPTRSWLGPEALLGRGALYIVILSGLALLLAAPSRVLDRGRRRPAWGAIGGILIGVVGSMMSFDWLMSLEPGFHSSVFGLYVLSGAALSGFAFSLLFTLRAGDASEHPRLLGEERLVGQGNLFLSLVLIWGYFAFVQWLVVWSGNTPRGADWYLQRSHGAWLVLAWLYTLAQGLLPLAVLISVRARTSAPTLQALCALVLAGHLLEMIWIIGPAFEPTLPWILPLVPALLAVGGLLLWLVRHQLRSAGRWLPTAEPHGSN